ncbi:MAG: ATP-binding protein [Acidithiobacillales bacterium]
MFAPGGEIPDGIRRTLVEAGAEALVAGSLEEAASALSRERPDAVLVVPPGHFSDAAGLVARLPADRTPPPVFVLSGEDSASRSPAVEVLSPDRWAQAAASLGAGAGDADSGLLLSRVELTALLALWEEVIERNEDLSERALRTLARFLEASRVSLFRWKPGDAQATVVASSLGSPAVGRGVEIARYPELRAAAARSGAVLVEEVESDPLMDDASRFLAGAPVRSLLCQRLPGTGSALFLHAVRDTVPFGLTDVALVGATVRLLQAVRDVRAPRGTGAKAERKRLRAVELLFRGIPEPTALVSTTGEILLANPPFLALTGRVASEVIGLDHRALLRPALPEDEFGPLSESAGSEVTARRARLAAASGESIPVEVLSLPAADETYSQSGWSALTLRDLRPDHARRARELVLEKEVAEANREVAESQRRLRESDASRARFWTAAAHELRTPLAIVQSHLEVVLSDLADGIPEQPAALLASASESLRRLERLIADVLDATVAGRARTPAALADVALPEVLEGIRPDLSATAFRRGCALTIDVPPGLPLVRGDSERVERLLFSLIDHSLRASPKGETVAVTAAYGDRGVEVRILDAGPAFPPGRAEELSDDIGSARGSAEFGLAVARRLADAMGAELRTKAEPGGAAAKIVSWPAGRC